MIINSEPYQKALNEGSKAKHTEASKEVIRKVNLGKKLSPELKEKLSLNSQLSKSIIAINETTGEIFKFKSIKIASEHFGVHYDTLRKKVKQNKPLQFNEENYILNYENE